MREPVGYLEDKEVASLDEDAKRLELSIVFIPSANSVVKSILASTLPSDGAGELDFICWPVINLVVYKPHKCPPPSLLLLLVIKGINQILQLGPTQMTRPDPKHKADGIHQVWLSSSIRPNYSCEIAKRPDCLKPFVGFEILHLQPMYLSLTNHPRHGFQREITVSLLAARFSSSTPTPRGLGFCNSSEMLGLSRLVFWNKVQIRVRSLEIFAFWRKN